MKLTEVIQQALKLYENKLLDKPTYTVSQLSKKHNVPENQIKAQLKKGIKIELEHTSDKYVAREIALDHLNEKPNYYDLLDKVEK